VIEARDGFMQAYAYNADRARPVELPPAVGFGITDCYIKPNPCCRHIQPAVEALVGILNDEKIASEDVKHVAVETYRIAAEHAGTGWDDYASAQLSFKYLMSLGLKFRNIEVAYFEDAVRNDPGWAALASKFEISAPHEIDRLYPKLRPARVTVTTSKGKKFVRQADEAMGSRLVPLDDDGLKAKFIGLVEPVHGAKTQALAQQLWDIDGAKDITPLIDALAKPAR
jgi:2-methylcitrate dehydratase PrpD